METIKVLLADDHLITREGVRRLLTDEPNFKVIGEASDGEEAVQRVSELHPDVVIMDVAMPKLNGIEATRQIKLNNPEIAVLILTAYDDDEYVFGLLEAGASGYLLKTASGDTLIRAINAVYKNEPMLDPIIARKVLDRFRFPSKVQPTPKVAEPFERPRDGNFETGGGGDGQQGYRGKTGYQPAHCGRRFADYLQQAGSELPRRSYYLRSEERLVHPRRSILKLL
jgi:DNA-binding NarL/FixJ family response regulator